MLLMKLKATQVEQKVLLVLEQLIHKIRRA
jgi:hypothetical protein